MIDQVKLSRNEILWQGVVVASLLVIIFEIPLSLIGLKVEGLSLLVDIYVSLICIIDFICSYRKRVLRAEIPEPFTRPELIFSIIACLPFTLLSYGTGYLCFSFLSLFKIYKIIPFIRHFTVFSGLDGLPGAVRGGFYSCIFFAVLHWISSGWMALNEAEPAQSLLSYYIKSLYWAVTTLTTIGYGDITPTTDIQRIYTMAIMILGVGLYGVVIGNFTKFLAQEDKYKEIVKDKMNDVSLFMKHYDVPEDLQAAIYSYYNNLYKKNLSDNDDKIVSELPKALQDQVKVYMSIKLIRNIPLFRDASLAAQKAVALGLDHVYFNPGENIIKTGEIGDEMFILSDGVVEVEIEGKGVVAQLSDGSFFGEMALIEKSPRMADINAKTFCTLYRLKKDDFIVILEKYPELLQRVTHVIKRRKGD